MNTITVLFTRRRWNAISWLIRWAVPRSRFALSLSSHCMVLAGDTVYEATMLHGVRRVPREVAMHGQHLVKMTQYQVPRPSAGLEWLDAQVGKPYDWGGAFGLSLAPDRRWSDASAWYCYELAAAALHAAGRPAFADLNHIGETALMSIAPEI